MTHAIGVSVNSSLCHANLREALKLSYRYLKEIGYKVNLTDKQNGGVEDGHAFHIWKTHVGTIWFETPFFESF
jgi:hypothetical protein